MSTEIKTELTQRESAEEKTEAKRSRWIDEPDVPAKEKKPSRKKKFFIQIPVIISFCLVIVSLLGYFTYKAVMIKEPEGAVWKWTSEDGSEWYFEFKNDQVYITGETYEAVSNYVKHKSDDGTSTLELPCSSLYRVACMIIGDEMEYEISGTRIMGNQTMKISYTTKEYSSDPVTGLTTVLDKEEEYVLEQVPRRETKKRELPDDFQEDEELTGKWISAQDDNRYYVFNDDGSCEYTVILDSGENCYIESTLFLTYDLDGNQMLLKMDSDVTQYTYAISDGVMSWDGIPYFYKAD